MKHIRRSLWASGLSLLLCLVLLAGTTLAWFTDSVTNKGNIITAGNLSIDATFYDVDMATGDKSFTIPNFNGGNAIKFEATGEDLKGEGCPAIINESLWEPGKSSAKLLEVVNNGTLAAKIKLQFNVTDNGLMNALWFDFVQVDANGNVTGSFQERPMSDLATFAKDLELPLAANGGTVRFILVYGMYEEASNVYMNKSFSADVTILATQDTVEEDGFGNTDYDAGAEYSTADVSTADQLKEAAAKGQNVRLTDSIVLTETVTFAEPAVLSLNGHDITINGGTGSIKTQDKLVVEGNGTINGALVADAGATLVINGGEDFTINSNFVTGAAVSMNLNSTLEINGGTYIGNVEGGAGVINAMGSYVTIRNATVNINADTMMHLVGISAPNAQETLLENVTVNAGYSVAAQLNTSMPGHATIIGGTFTTDRVADTWNPNATIKYGGTLNISDATIVRVGTGILYYKAYPKPAEVVGLTQSDVIFQQADAAVAGYLDVDHNR